MAAPAICSRRHPREYRDFELRTVAPPPPPPRKADGRWLRRSSVGNSLGWGGATGYHQRERQKSNTLAARRAECPVIEIWNWRLSRRRRKKQKKSAFWECSVYIECRWNIFFIGSSRESESYRWRVHRSRQLVATFFVCPLSSGRSWFVPTGRIVVENVVAAGDGVIRSGNSGPLTKQKKMSSETNGDIPGKCSMARVIIVCLGRLPRHLWAQISFTRLVETIERKKVFS